MSKKVYRKITFANDFNRSFAEFKEDFAENHVFLSIPEDQREAEFVKAYRVAMPDADFVQEGQMLLGDTDADGENSKTLKTDGKFSATIKEGKKA